MYIITAKCCLIRIIILFIITHLTAASLSASLNWLTSESRSGISLNKLSNNEQEFSVNHFFMASTSHRAADRDLQTTYNSWTLHCKQTEKNPDIHCNHVLHKCILKLFSLIKTVSFYYWHLFIKIFLFTGKQDNMVKNKAVRISYM